VPKDNQEMEMVAGQDMEVRSLQYQAAARLWETGCF
jgi:hypothetical protein